MPIKIIYSQAYGPYPPANIPTHKAKTFSLYDSLIAHNFCMSAYNQFVQNFYYNANPCPCPCSYSHYDATRRDGSLIEVIEVHRGEL